MSPYQILTTTQEADTPFITHLTVEDIEAQRVKKLPRTIQPVRGIASPSGLLYTKRHTGNYSASLLVALLCCPATPYESPFPKATRYKITYSHLCTHHAFCWKSALNIPILSRPAPSPSGQNSAMLMVAKIKSKKGRMLNCICSMIAFKKRGKYLFAHR